MARHRPRHPATRLPAMAPHKSPRSAPPQTPPHRSPLTPHYSALDLPYFPTDTPPLYPHTQEGSYKHLPLTPSCPYRGSSSTPITGSHEHDLIHPPTSHHSSPQILRDYFPTPRRPHGFPTDPSIQSRHGTLRATQYGSSHTLLSLPKESLIRTPKELPSVIPPNFYDELPQRLITDLPDGSHIKEKIGPLHPHYSAHRAQLRLPTGPHNFAHRLPLGFNPDPHASADEPHHNQLP